ncbi:MAG: hypothetical protein GEEBNDBF_00353 [bacterium]|nr:hypothetical protein [bacterium]
MLHPFFQAPFKAACMSILGVGALVCLGTASTPATADTTPGLKADLRVGGEELFKTIIPSVIQITNGGAGSGYIIDKGGYAISNTHVTSPNQVFEIAMYGMEKTGKRYRGVLIGEDPALDFALLKVEAPPEAIHPMKLGDTDKMKVGDTVATCGSPGGSAGATNLSDFREGWLDFFNFNLGTLTEILPFEHSMIYFQWQAAYGYEPFAADYGTAVQYLFHVDSAINKGNSGGPAMNARGEAIGTNTWGFGASTGQTENIGFSVPVNLLTRSAREILQYGRVRRPWLGVALHLPNPPAGYFMKANAGLSDYSSDSWIDPTPDQMTIHLVNSYSPAAQYLKKGDIIRSIDGQRYSNIFDVYKHILNKQVGDSVSIQVERNGVGLPPVTIELTEKKNRYDAIKLTSSTLNRTGGSRIYQVTY